VNAADYLSYTWSSLTNSDIWVEWPLGLAEGLVKPGILNNAPAVDFLNTQIAGFPEGYKRKVVMSAVNVETGEYTSFN